MSPSKSEWMYEKIKTAVINQEFGLQEVINEKTLAEMYSVSKTPVREALNQLVQDGYLIKYPRMGYYVKELNLKEFYEIVQLRFIIESGVMRTVIRDCGDAKIATLWDVMNETEVPYEQYNAANEKFHLAMAGLIDNRYVRDALQKVFERCYRRFAYDYYKQVQHDIHRDHRVIVQTLLERNEEKAIELLRQELRRSDDAESRF